MYGCEDHNVGPGTKDPAIWYLTAASYRLQRVDELGLVRFGLIPSQNDVAFRGCFQSDGVNINGLLSALSHNSDNTIL